MDKLVVKVLAGVGLLTVVGLLAVALAVAFVWWQDRQWQAKVAREREKEEKALPPS